MRDRELNAFLASVRRARFVDYLDPLGETAQSAFDRRLAWARSARHDPASAEEAHFLIQNADALREVLRSELEASDWIEEADVGHEWETRGYAKPAQPAPSRPPNPRASASRQPSAGRTSAPRDVRRPSQDDELPSDLDDRSSSSVPTEVQGRGRMPPSRAPKSAAPSKAPPNPRVAPATGSAGRSTAPRVAAAQPPRRLPAFPSTEIAYGDPVDEGSREQRAEPRPRSTAPAPRGIGPRAGEAQVGAARRQVSAHADGRGPQVGRAPPMNDRGAPRSVAPRSLPARGGRSAAPVYDAQAPSQDATAAMASIDDLGPSGIMNLEDFSGFHGPRPPAWDDGRSDGPIPGSADPTVAMPFAALHAEAHGQGVPLDEHGSSMGAQPGEWPPNRLRRNTGTGNLEPVSARHLPARSRTSTPASAGRVSRPARAPFPEYPEIQPRRRRSWAVPIATVMFLLVMAGAVIGGGLQAYPYLVKTGALDDVKALVAEAGDTVTREVAKATAPDPGSAASKPAPEANRPAGGAVASQAPAEGVAAAAVSGSERQEVRPVPASVAPAVVASAPPRVERASSSLASASRSSERSSTSTRPSSDVARAETAAAPEPARPSAPPVDVQGLWVGSTTTGMSFKLTVLEQKNGGAFEGTVEVQREDGTFDSLSIAGTVDSTGVMSFKGGGGVFNGTVTSDRRRAVGTYKFNGGDAVKWYAVH